MSNTQVAFIGRARVPSRSALQASIDALGFDLKLDPQVAVARLEMRPRWRVLPDEYSLGVRPNQLAKWRASR